MPEYKLTYFDFKGRGEPLRMMFKVAGVAFEDVRIPFKPDATDEEKQVYKKDAPFGTLPLLEVDGKIICQSDTITRYLAREFGLNGKTSWDEARADMVVQCLEDILFPLEVIFFEEDESRKKEKIKTFAEVTMSKLFTYLENILKSNGGGDGYFVGNELTYADIAFINYITWPSMICNTGVDFSPWPKLNALKDRVESIPQIAAWIKQRPAALY